MHQENSHQAASILNNPPSWYHYFGLYTLSEKIALPLKRVKVDAKIHEYIAEITYSQVYYNPNPALLETEYFFPISSTACFHGFKAKFGSTVIEGTIKKKEQANEEYQKYIQDGSLTAYAEILEENFSVICVKIANIPPKSDIEIIFNYTERVEISLNKFWQFTIYSCLVPRRFRRHFNTSSPSTLQHHQKNVLANYPMTAIEDISDPTWEVDVVLESRSPINFLKSTSHEVQISRSKSSGVFSAHIRLMPKMGYVPNKDFVILYANELINKPSYLLSPYEDGYCTLINFFPEINYLSFDDAYMASLEGKDPLEQLTKEAKKEFILLIDRTSIDRRRAKLLNEVLVNFISSIPAGSYIDIFDLGQDLKEFQRIKLSEETRTDTLQKLLGNNKQYTFSNHPESDIIHALEAIGRIAPIYGFERAIFVLTGGVTSTTTGEATNIIKEKCYKTRVFTLGIGESSLTDFIRRVALEGYGTYEVIRTIEEIPGKIAHLLKVSIAPYFTDFELKIEHENLFSYIVPLPKSLGCISPNELVEFFVIFNKKLEDVKITTFTLKFYNSFNQRVEEFKQEINVEHAEFSDAVVRLGILKLCESLNKKKEVYQAMGKGEIAESFRKDIEKQLVNTSLKYGILTSSTAFICMIQEGNDLARQIPVQKMIMSIKPMEIAQSLSLSKEDKPLDAIISGFVFETKKKSSHLYRNKKGTGKAIQHKPQAQDASSDRASSFPLEKISGKSQVKTKIETTNNEKKARAAGSSKKGGVIKERLRDNSHKNEKLSQSHSILPQSNRKESQEGNKVGSSKQKYYLIPGFSRVATEKSLEIKNISWVPGKIVKNLEDIVTPKDIRPSLPSSTKRKTNQTTPRVSIRSVTNESNSSLRKQNHFDNTGKSIEVKMRNKSSRLEEKTNLHQDVNILSRLTVSQEKLVNMIKLQKVDGYWEPQTEVETLLGTKVEILLDNMPIGISKHKENERVWLTLLIMIWVKHYSTSKLDWKPMYKKATNWLKKQEKDYHHYYNKARNVLRF